MAAKLILALAALFALGALVGCDPAPPQGKEITGQEYNDLANQTMTDEEKKALADSQAAMNAGGQGVKR